MEEKRKNKIKNTIENIITVAIIIGGTCRIAYLYNNYATEKKKDESEDNFYSIFKLTSGNRAFDLNESSSPTIFKKNSNQIYVMGETIESIINSFEPDYIEMFGEYYTKNGEDIMFLERTITTDAKIVNGVYTVPKGYTLRGNQGYFTCKDALIAENGEFTIPEWFTQENIVTTVESKPYAELIEYDLLLQSGDKYFYNENLKKEYETEYVLQKRK